MGRKPLTPLDVDEWEQNRPPTNREALMMNEGVQATIHALFARARIDPVCTFDLVAREETSKVKIRALPHQRLFFDFVMAHRHCVVFEPPGTSKTFNTAFITLFLLGNDPTERGAIISATQPQARKPLGMVRSYIEESKELKAIFPKLQPTLRRGEPWTKDAITVHRPPGIRDPSLVAVGIDGALPGSRLSWIVVDDILNRENTATHEQRLKVIDFFDLTVLSRNDMKTGRCIVTNTAHHEHDLQHYLLKKGWPTLRMELEGNVWIYNTDWDSPLIRPAKHTPLRPNGPYRLTDHDKDGFDEFNTKSMWPAKYDADVVAELKRNHTPRRYAQLFKQECRDEESQRCKDSWIEACKERGKGLKQLHKYEGPNLVTTGVDLAFREGEEHDFTAFVTVEFMQDGSRRLLEVEYGQWDSPTIVDKCIEKAELFKCILRVENNAAQDTIIQFARKRNKALRIRPHTTGRNKAHPEYGVEGMFVEVRNAGWIFPCDDALNCDESVQWLLEGMATYDPAKHTHDGLMALWFAVEQGRELGAFRTLKSGAGGFGGLMSR